jgi:4-aminobutyrate aminotransferase-like enzyme
MCELLAFQFSQTEIITGNYSTGRIIKAGLQNWQEHESKIKQYRGSGIFDFAAFMLYTDEKKQATPEPVTKQGILKQQTLW